MLIAFLLLLKISMNAVTMPMTAIQTHFVATQEVHLLAAVTKDTREMADIVWVCL